jgi:hypothetical protein
MRAEHADNDVVPVQRDPRADRSRRPAQVPGPDHHRGRIRLIDHQVRAIEVKEFPASSVTAANTSAGAGWRATSVATRCSAASSSADRLRGPPNHPRGREATARTRLRRRLVASGEAG